MSFLLSKARVTPMKAMSVARLELMAAQLGAETSVPVKQYLGQSLETYFYTDSMDVLFWLSQPSKCFKPYVANRSGIVQSLTKIKNWRHIPSAQNAADVATRGSKVASLAVNSLWWAGPPFLGGSEENFPKKFCLEEHTVDNGVKDEMRPFLSFQNEEEAGGVTTFLDPNKFSVGNKWDGWKILRRRTSMLLRLGSVSEQDIMQKSEVVLFRLAQRFAFKEVIECIESGKQISRKDPLAQFTPFLDGQGLLRSRSRLEHSDIIPEGTRFPIILPSRSRITLLMVMSLHLTLQHAVGDNLLRGHLAKNFVIPSLYYIERKIKKECFTCIKRTATTAEQQMGALPDYRYQEPLQVFSRVGIDFAGPFMIKQKRTTRSNPCRPKHYVLVFTCLATRAVHFEVTPAIDTEAVLNALSRFSDRRGVPEVIVSDNGTSFVAADKTLKDLHASLDQTKLREATVYGYKQGNGIKWEFNPPYASHMGGVYETIVKALKRALHATYGYADLLIDEFVTAVAGAEGLLNSRPLAEVKMGSQESVVLTPNHFLNCPGGDLYLPSEGTVDLGKRWRYLNRLQSHYKSRFIQEILPQLHPRRKWKIPRESLKVNDLVLEMSESEPKSLWKLARIVQVFPGADDCVRKVKVQFRGGDTEFLRPVNKLLPLEFDN